MASDFVPVDATGIEASGSEFNAFCDFVVQIQKQGAESLTPEQSVQEFRNHQSQQQQQWQEKNLLSQQQSQRGEAKPLDDKAILARLRTRLAQNGKSE